MEKNMEKLFSQKKSPGETPSSNEVESSDVEELEHELDNLANMIQEKGSGSIDTENFQKKLDKYLKSKEEEVKNELEKTRKKLPSSKFFVNANSTLFEDNIKSLLKKAKNEDERNVLTEELKREHELQEKVDNLNADLKLGVTKGYLECDYNKKAGFLPEKIDSYIKDADEDIVRNASEKFLKEIEENLEENHNLTGKQREEEIRNVNKPLQYFFAVAKLQQKNPEANIDSLKGYFIKKLGLNPSVALELDNAEEYLKEYDLSVEDLSTLTASDLQEGQRIATQGLDDVDNKKVLKNLGKGAWAAAVFLSVFVYPMSQAIAGNLENNDMTQENEGSSNFENISGWIEGAIESAKHESDFAKQNAVYCLDQAMGLNFAYSQINDLAPETKMKIDNYFQKNKDVLLDIYTDFIKDIKNDHSLTPIEQKQKVYNLSRAVLNENDNFGQEARNIFAELFQDITSEGTGLIYNENGEISKIYVAPGEESPEAEATNFDFEGNTIELSEELEYDESTTNTYNLYQDGSVQAEIETTYNDPKNNEPVSTVKPNSPEPRSDKPDYDSPTYPHSNPPEHQEDPKDTPEHNPEPTHDDEPHHENPPEPETDPKHENPEHEKEPRKEQARDSEMQPEQQDNLPIDEYVDKYNIIEKYEYEKPETLSEGFDKMIKDLNIDMSNTDQKEIALSLIKQIADPLNGNSPDDFINQLNKSEFNIVAYDVNAYADLMTAKAIANGDIEAPELINNSDYWDYINSLIQGQKSLNNYQIADYNYYDIASLGGSDIPTPFDSINKTFVEAKNGQTYMKPNAQVVVDNECLGKDISMGISEGKSINNTNGLPSSFNYIASGNVKVMSPYPSEIDYGSYGFKGKMNVYSKINNLSSKNLDNLDNVKCYVFNNTEETWVLTDPTEVEIETFKDANDKNVNFLKGEVYGLQSYVFIEDTTESQESQGLTKFSAGINNIVDGKSLKQFYNLAQEKLQEKFSTELFKNPEKMKKQATDYLWNNL